MTDDTNRFDTLAFFNQVSTADHKRALRVNTAFSLRKGAGHGRDFRSQLYDPKTYDPHPTITDFFNQPKGQDHE